MDEFWSTRIWKVRIEYRPIVSPKPTINNRNIAGFPIGLPESPVRFAIQTQQPRTQTPAPSYLIPTIEHTVIIRLHTAHLNRYLGMCLKHFPEDLDAG